MIWLYFGSDDFPLGKIDLFLDTCLTFLDEFAIKFGCKPNIFWMRLIYFWIREVYFWKNLELICDGNFWVDFQFSLDGFKYIPFFNPSKFKRCSKYRNYMSVLASYIH